MDATQRLTFPDGCFVPSEFQRLLKPTRLLKGRLLSDLAKATGIPTFLLRAYEEGTEPPTVEAFAAIWDALSTDAPSPRAEAR